MNALQTGGRGTQILIADLGFDGCFALEHVNSLSSLS
jgi:hypothetical protein